MASKYFLGGTFTAVAQVDTLTVGGTIEADDVFNVIMTGEDGTAVTLAVTAGSTVISTVCTAIATAFNASTDARFTPVTAAAGATTVTLTADTAGVPFACSVTTTELGGGAADAQTFSRAATTANKGSGDWGTAANWSDLTVPVSTDNVVLDGRMTTAITYGLNQSAVTLATLKHNQGAKAVGTASAALRISATIADSNLLVENGASVTPTFFNINFGTVQTTWSNYGSSNQGTSGLEPVIGDGTHASNVFNIYGGIVGIGTMTPGDTSVVATLNVIGSGAKAVVSSGTTLTTLNLEEGGRAVVRCAATTINVKDQACSLTTEGSGAITTLNCNGNATLNSTGAITNLHIEDSGSVNTRATNNAGTISNAFVYGNGSLKTDLNRTFTNGVDCLRGAKSNQTDFGDSVTVTPSAV